MRRRENRSKERKWKKEQEAAGERETRRKRKWSERKR